MKDTFSPFLKLSLTSKKRPPIRTSTFMHKYILYYSNYRMNENWHLQQLNGTRVIFLSFDN